MTLANLNIGKKIYLVTGILILIFTASSFWLYGQYRDQLYEGSREQLVAAVDTAWGIIDHYSKSVGEDLSRSEAQMLAKSAIRALRFGDGSYFWINDTTPKIVMHPIKPQLEGKDMSTARDPNGVYLFKEMVNVTAKDGAGFVEYQWAKPGHDKPVDKLSYVRRHPDWGWIVGAGVYLDDVQSRVAAAFWSVIGVLGFALLVSAALVWFLARHVSRPLHQTVEMIEEMEKGHLDRRLNMDRKDEMGRMAKAMDAFADSLQNEVVASLQRLATGDLTFSIEPRDNRDVVRGALQKLEQDLNRVMLDIQSSGEQIAAGAGQVSDSSQSLSQGATESASSLEEISASMNEMSSQTRQNAENADQANRLSDEAQAAAEKGNQQMQEMVSAMGEIADAGQNISKIIKVIDEIAFQTNLLALNAAVEAARAGQHGKGFAVVAEEVRNLAARSARAARETAELIEGSVDLTERGSHIAGQTAEALGKIVDGVTKVSNLVSEIAAASNEQAQGIAQVNQGLAQIDQVTQQNTANAEEGAAASEELSSQAAQLHNMLSRFKLKQHAMATVPTTIPAAAPPRPPQPVAANGNWGGISSAPRGEDMIALNDDEFGRY
ncbi:chemotaxis protein [Geothermobacter hydrogeniphilus]|uniref:Chemotaxis protein n=1 Tax=Geothermobacter hydrogeniphilus TaxID=1969733 RepID=A0A2K2H5U3_9BACT|nr:methyl-accepting chemotaxis protein [Geothermobacter hydrogeniphilus]PNU18696.1 chemotaxis protein [Geothermobacter hydrogeniphilus]